MPEPVSQKTTSGGGIHNESQLILKNTLIQFNDASSQGGGVYSWGVSLVVDNSEIHNNSALTGGGVWSYDDLLTVANGTLFESNESGNDGAGLYAQGLAGSISHSSFENNTGGQGAGFYSGITGQLDIEYSTFSNNISDDYGGGVYLNYALYNIKNSAIINNRTSAEGGGLIIDSTAFAANISNTTISGNISDSPDAGAGGLTAYDATVNLYNVTITNNSGGFAGGISDWEQDTTVFNIHNSIIYGNLGTTFNDCDVQLGSIDFDGKPSILGNSTGCTPLNTSMVSATDPQLAALADNGGPTQTHALEVGSPAIGAGDNSLCADVSTVNNLDQRDVARPFGSQCDLGAFEFNTDFMFKDGFEFIPAHLELPISIDEVFR